MFLVGNNVHMKSSAEAAVLYVKCREEQLDQLCALLLET